MNQPSFTSVNFYTKPPQYFGVYSQPTKNIGASIVVDERTEDYCKIHLNGNLIGNSEEAKEATLKLEKECPPTQIHKSGFKILAENLIFKLKYKLKIDTSSKKLFTAASTESYRNSLLNILDTYPQLSKNKYNKVLAESIKRGDLESEPGNIFIGIKAPYNYSLQDIKGKLNDSK